MGGEVYMGEGGRWGSTILNAYETQGQGQAPIKLKKGSLKKKMIDLPPMRTKSKPNFEPLSHGKKLYRSHC